MMSFDEAVQKIKELQTLDPKDERHFCNTHCRCIDSQRNIDQMVFLHSSLASIIKNIENEKFEDAETDIIVVFETGVAIGIEMQKHE
jgi:hypothetical protein